MSTAQPAPAALEPRRFATIGELFEALESSLLSYALRLAGEPATAEDIVQEAFLKLHGQFDQVRDPRRWLYRTVHNLALNQRRAAAKIVAFSQPRSADPAQEAETADPGPLPDELLARWETIGLVRRGLQKLDERDRELVRLKFAEELSYRDLSARTGLTVGHVGYLLHHALKALAAEMTSGGLSL